MKTVLILACAAITALCACVCAWGAPAPFAKPERSERRVEPLITPGHYELVWNDTPCNLWLLSGGLMRCDFGESDWTGTWTFEDGTLRISETVNPDDPNAWRWWSVRLCEKRTGRTCTSERWYPDATIAIKRK